MWALSDVSNASEYNYDILVIRVSADNKFRIVNSRPCIDCAYVLKGANVRYIYFSNEYGEIEKTHKSDFESRHIPRKQVHLGRVL